jgi:TRAP-type C4-dicarboxylate transport system substrate-binding protein
MLNRRTLMLAGAAGALATPFLSRGAAAQAKWQVATAYPDGNFHTANLRQFLTEIEGATGGKFAAQVHSNASLLPMPQIKRGVQTGQVQVGEIMMSAYGNEDPFFEVDAIPQLVTTHAQAKILADLSRPFIEARLNRTGATLLYMVPWPPSGFYTNFPVDTLDKLRGTKLRTFSAATNRFATLIGATPTLVQQAEVPQAFATGVVNAMVTSAATGVDVQAWDFCKQFTPIGFTFTKNIIIARTRDVEALAPEVKAAIKSAAATAETRGYAMSVEMMKEREGILAAKGMTVAQPSPALMEAMAKVGATMADEWVAKAGEEGKKLMDAYRAAI